MSGSEIATVHETTPKPDGFAFWVAFGCVGLQIAAVAVAGLGPAGGPRLLAVCVGLLAGPFLPLVARLAGRTTALEAILIGAGLNLAGGLIVAEILILTHTWALIVAAILWSAATVVAALGSNWRRAS